MKNTRKLIILTNAIPISFSVGFVTVHLSSCSCNLQNIKIKQKQVATTTNKVVYEVLLDKEYSNLNDFNVVSDLEVINIDGLKLSQNTLFIYITKKTETKSKEFFGLTIKYKNVWEKHFSDLEIIKTTVDDEIKQHDTESWKHAIQHIVDSKHPTLYFGGGASYYLQQMLNLYFATSQLAIQQDKTFNTPGYEYNDQIAIIPFYMYKYKTNEKSGTYLTYDWKTMIDNTFGYTDILKTSPFSLKSGNNMLITNLQDLDTSLENYDSSLESYVPCVDGNTTYLNCKIVNKIFDLYEKIDPNIKFNYVMMDFGFDEVSKLKFNLKTDDDKKLAEEINKTQVRMIKHQDKMYFLSDGSYTWNTQNKTFSSFYQQQNYLSASQQHFIWQQIINSKDEDAFKILWEINNMIFYNNEQFCYHFAPSTTTPLAESNLNEYYNLSKQTTYKFSNSWILLETYKQIFNNDNIYKRFCDSVFSTYNFFNSEEFPTKTFNDCVEVGTYRSGSEKNLIFIMPGALTPSHGEVDYNILDIMRNILSKIKTNYPTNEWNYIFKFHPRANKQKSIEIVKKLFSISEGGLPDYCIILKGKYAFEYLVVLDQYLAINTSNKKYHLIDPTTFDDEKPSGILTGFDLASTCFYSTISLLSKEYNINIEKAKKLIQYDAFFLSKKMLVPEYIYNEQGAFEQNNLMHLHDLYYSLYSTGEFINTDIISFID